jgi:tRNA threonylcarbamoyladenosine biosynthesis protein TsaB
LHVLALETSGRVGSIALIEADGDSARVLREVWLSPGERTARSLLPGIDALLRQYAWRPADVELIATTTGPGSFTGLRIGVVAAKTLAYATGAKLVGVHTLAAIAAGAGATAAQLWTVLDAQRQELFVASFDTRRPIADQATPTTEILSIDAWLARLSPGDAVAGPPLAKCRDRLPEGVAILDEAKWSPAAAFTGQLAVELFHCGATVDPLALVPNYFRKSAAEEKSPAPSPSP